LRLASASAGRTAAAIPGLGGAVGTCWSLGHGAGMSLKTVIGERAD
jgi:hypothetical protein